VNSDNKSLFYYNQTTMSEKQGTTPTNAAKADSLAMTPVRVGVLGFGGLGQAAAKVLAPKQEMIWVAAADQKGYAYDALV
jgi:glutamate dehydrogenase/leucine dehydrogenase